MRLTAKEIAKILGISRIAVLKRAKKENWLFVEEPRADGKGSPAKYYIVETLPEDVQEKVLSVTSKCNQSVTKWNLSVTSKNRIDTGVSENGKSVSVTKMELNGTEALFEDAEKTEKNKSGSLVEAGLTNFSGLTNEPNEPKIGFTNEPAPQLWLSTNQVAKLLGISDRAVQKRCRNGKFLSRVVPSNKGFGGKVYEVALSCLPEQAQVKWVQENEEEAKRLPEHIKDKLSPQAQWEIMRLTAPVEGVGLEVLRQESLKNKVARKIEAIQKALSCPPDRKKSVWIREVAEEFGISPKTLYRDIKIYREKGLSFLVKPRSSKGLVAWDQEALDFLRGVYLKAVREGGDCSKRRAYQAVVAEAKKKGWRVGCESSAFAYLQKFNPLLEKYARGGRRALDNVFYIMRDYRDLSPFEVIVGDQHRFDFWVRVAETGDVFRPECFLWLDMRTRLIYGISVARHYDKYLVGHAMRMGLLRFGKFRSCYTDNGKPEISNYVNTVINDIAGWGSQVADMAELYRAEDGYVIEGPDGEPLEVVRSPRQWHRRARAYNAKAKPIERFFRSFEGIMRDLGTPGLVRELKGLSEERALSDRRLKHLIKTNQLLTFEEFLVKVFEAVQVYNQRRHAALGRAPIDELWRAVKEEGFVPRYLPESEIDFVLLARTTRKVQRGRILLNHTWYQGDPISQDNLEAGLWHLPDKTEIEVRYDPFDAAKVIAVLPDGSTRKLYPVPVSSMKDKEKTNRVMAWKRQMMQAVIEHYRRLTRPVPGIIEYSKHTRAAIHAKRKMSGQEIEAEARRIVEESMKGPQKVVPIVARPVFQTDWDYYKWCLDCMIAGQVLSERDRAFMRDYEAKMDGDEKVYWEGYRRIYGEKKAI